MTKKFRVWVTAQSEHGMHRTPLGHLDIWAKTPEEAKEHAINYLWEPRLTAASCSPVCDWKEIEDED